MRPRQDRIAVLILVEDHVEIGARTGEIVFEGLGFAAEASEQPAAVILRAHFEKAHVGGIEAGTIGIAQGHALEPASVVVAPVVIEADEARGVAFGVAAHGCAAMSATVVE